MSYTDLGDAIEDMKTRAEHRAFNVPFLYDGETQDARRSRPGRDAARLRLRPGRKLRYQGRIDTARATSCAKVADTRLCSTPCTPEAPCRSRRPDGRLLDQMAEKTASTDAEQDASGKSR